jgi:hypothetical protein
MEDSRPVCLVLGVRSRLCNLRFLVIRAEGLVEPVGECALSSKVFTRLEIVAAVAWTLIALNWLHVLFCAKVNLIGRGLDSHKDSVFTKKCLLIRAYDCGYHKIEFFPQLTKTTPLTA